MRKIKDDLFQLIKSLDRNEKGYFKKFTLLYSAFPESVNNYTRLFDAIDSMEVYDEVALKKQFTGEKFIKQLHVTKNYLYSSILRSLRNYSSEATDNLKISSNLQDAELLIRKGHYEKALETIHSTRKFAFEREFWGHVTELIEMERIIHTIYLKDDTIKSMGQLASERASIINILKSEQELVEISHLSRARTFRHGQAQPAAELKKFTKLFKKKLEDSENSARTVYAKNMLSTEKTVYYWLTAQSGLAYEESLSGLDFLKQHSFFFRKNPFTLYNKAFNLGASLVNQRKHDELKKLLKEIAEYSKTFRLQLNPKLNGFILTKLTQHYIAYFINSLQIVKGLEYLKSAAKAVELNEKEINKNDINKFNFLSAVFYITAGNYKNAVKCLNQLLILNVNALSPDEKLFSKYLLLISHYELGNLENLTAVNKLFGPGESIEPLDFLKEKLPKIKNKNDEKKLFIDFKNRLMTSENKNVLAKYFDFVSWAESKIQNKPFAEIARRS